MAGLGLPARGQWREARLLNGLNILSEHADGGETSFFAHPFLGEVFSLFGVGEDLGRNFLAVMPRADDF